jgi:hypothetical protein
VVNCIATDLVRLWVETGDWRLETGDWRLETGDWRLETAGDCWRLLETAGDCWRLLETAGDPWDSLTGEMLEYRRDSFVELLDSFERLWLRPMCNVVDTIR